jgi:phosphoribosylamine-glycine ligase
MGNFTSIDDNGNFKKEKGWVTAGTYYMVVNALGNSIEQAQKRVYKTVDQLHTPGSWFRDDIGEKVLKWLPDLQKHDLGTEFK